MLGGVPFNRTTHACRQDGGNMMCSDAVWGIYLAKKISLTLPVQADISLFAVGFCLPLMKSSNADLIRDSFQFVSQGFLDAHI